MSVYIDPYTAMTLAREARADRLRHVAGHRRYVEAMRRDRRAWRPSSNTATDHGAG